MDKKRIFKNTGKLILFFLMPFASNSLFLWMHDAYFHSIDVEAVYWRLGIMLALCAVITALFTAIRVKWYTDLAIGLYHFVFLILNLSAIFGSTSQTYTYLLVASSCFTAYGCVGLVRELYARFSKRKMESLQSESGE